MNRRGFLTGSLAVVAAPAVITTPGLLMPVSTLALPTYGPGGILTPSMIAREFNRRLQRMVGAVVIPGTEWHEQAGVDMKVADAEFALSLEDFSARYIAPAAASIASHIDHRGGKLSIGREMHHAAGALGSAVDDRNGVFARVIHYDDIFNQHKALRLEVLHS